MGQHELARFVDQGAAFAEVLRREGGTAERDTSAAPPAARSAGAERFDVMVIGGGQAGLSTGYHLKRRGVDFVILDAAQRVGDVWRNRWDSLRLFSPAHLDGLDGLRFPGPRGAFPTKDEMGDYLEEYARHFALPVRSGWRVDRLTRRDGRFVARCGDREVEAGQVVVAMSGYQEPRAPACAAELRDDIVQLHSIDYRSPSQLRDGPVLLVGAGNSGAEIAIDLASRHRVWMAGRHTGQIPFRIGSRLGRTVLARMLMRLVFHRLLTVRTPIGRRVRPKMLHAAGPLVRTRLTELAAAGVETVPRLTGVRDGLPLLEDGRTLDAANVIWCTGFHPGFSWIDLPVFDAVGDPLHESGVVPSLPGLYFVGLHFLHAMSSGMIHGVGRDARRIAEAVARRAVVAATG